MDKETIEGNKLISRFASDSKNPYSENGDFITYIGLDAESEYWDYDKMKYHSSWDWLKPVVDKIFTYSLAYPEQTKWVCDAKIVVDINPCWENVVKFIDYLNQKSNQ